MPPCPPRLRTSSLPPLREGGPSGAVQRKRPLGLGVTRYYRERHASGTITPHVVVPLGREFTQVLAYQGGAYLRTVGHAIKSGTLLTSGL